MINFAPRAGRLFFDEIIILLILKKVKQKRFLAL